LDLGRSPILGMTELLIGLSLPWQRRRLILADLYHRAI
jgi:hypothetical protein